MLTLSYKKIRIWAYYTVVAPGVTPTGVIVPQQGG